MDKSKRLFLKSKRYFRRRLPLIQSGDRIDYRNMSLISRFISEQGKILSRRVNRLTLKQQRLITIAIKQARILSSLPAVKSQGSTLDRRWKLPSWSTVGAEGISGGAVKCVEIGKNTNGESTLLGH
ncbi:hypothetical protein PVK06_008921 [Gossypium arboreum]|uniref:Small ribosomal subunit protein bS18c n=1 Tax=Gossypium arboreum TaxID=29729 RepID=A0ABR0QMJ1_GOSAR|nr:hypothetical protein PVK06_008921 [Gossypium arboreum]